MLGAVRHIGNYIINHPRETQRFIARTLCVTGASIALVGLVAQEVISTSWDSNTKNFLINEGSKLFLLGASLILYDVIFYPFLMFIPNEPEPPPLWQNNIQNDFVFADPPGAFSAA